ncbi:MAG: flavodoxin domain-containing protein [Treponemataceae bacterium]|nr:flavodoxin domain-containing protein [Treponemataceae bacterium]
MKVAVRYLSKSGKTEAIAKAIAEALSANDQTVSAVSISDETELTEKVDLLFLGGAPYANIMAPELRDYAKKIDTSKVGKVALFSTSARSKRTLNGLNKILSSNNVPVCEEQFYAKAAEVKDKIEDAKSFAKRMAE